MLEQYSKYDYRVQLMRIFACFMVIGCHVRLEPVINNGLDKELLLLHGFYDDGVAIFFMIMGFFLTIGTKPLWKSAGKTFFRILFPVFLLKICLQLLDGWIINEASLLDCIAHPSVNLPAILINFVTLNFGAGNYSTHLWYIASYLRIVVALPLLQLLTADSQQASKVCKWLIFINVTGMLVNDLQAVFPLRFGTLGSFVIFDTAITYVVIGYVIYTRQTAFTNRVRYRILFLAGMIGINILRFVLQSFLFTRSLDNNYFYYWTTTIALVFSVCFIGFFLTFPKTATHKWLRIVNYIGTKTFVIYLIHIAVYTFLDHRGVRDWVYSFTVWHSPNLLTKLGYDIIYPAIVFVCCLLFTVCIDCVKQPLLRLFQHHS